jgi:hypothetical protein
VYFCLQLWVLLVYHKQIGKNILEMNVKSETSIKAGEDSNSFGRANDIFICKDIWKEKNKTNGEFIRYVFKESKEAMEELMTEIEESKGDSDKIDIDVVVGKIVVQNDDENDLKWLTKQEVDKIGGWITFNEEGKEGEITEYSDGTISSSEGQFFTRVPHVPNNKKIAIGNSGVTIGRGLDVGQLRDYKGEVKEVHKKILRGYLDYVGTKAEPINKNLYDFLFKAIGKTKSNAIDIWDKEKIYTEVNNVKKHKKEYTLSRKQQYYLFEAVYPLYRDKALKDRLQNRADSGGVGERMIEEEVNRLPQNIKDVLIDMTYQGHLKQAISDKIIPLLKTQQYEEVYEKLSKDKNMYDKYKGRLEIRLNHIAEYRPKEFKGVFK